ncbi:MAG TPA: hypothetical protein VFQ51_18720, partial [Vicinamibacteria bacterium]|nr:hypothetical protein [Vicinamibacteria bacterium]
VLLHAKDESRVTVTRAEAARRAATCASAVEVKRAALADGVLRLDLEHVGRARLAGATGKDVAAACGVPPSAYGVAVSGFASGDEAAAVEESLARLLVTPEAFLQARGTAFDRAPVSDPGIAASHDVPGSTAEERSLGRKVTAWPKALFSVSPELFVGRKEMRSESEVEFDGVVGPDGRLHGVKVTTPLAASQVAAVERALALWRFEPAATKEGPASAKVSLRTSLRVY